MEPPANLAEYEALIGASSAPAVLMVPRSLQRELIAYVRYLEGRLEAVSDALGHSIDG